MTAEPADLSSRPAPAAPGDDEGFFRPDGDALIPAAFSTSPWGQVLHGRLIGGLTARAVEQAYAADPGLACSRLTIDMFRSAPLAPVRVSSRAVRAGNRIAVLEVTVEQDGGPIGQGRAVLLRRAAQPEGQPRPVPRWDAPAPAELGPPPGFPAAGGRWTPPWQLWPVIPPESRTRAARDQAARAENPGSPAGTNGAGGPAGTNGTDGTDGTDGQAGTNGTDGTDGVAVPAAARARARTLGEGLWMREVHPLVTGEPLTPLQRVAMAADLVNPVANSGPDGLAFINADYTVYLGRQPRGEHVGLQPAGHISDEGVAVAQCVLHDLDGPLGFVTTTAVANAMRRRDA